MNKNIEKQDVFPLEAGQTLIMPKDVPSSCLITVD